MLERDSVCWLGYVSDLDMRIDGNVGDDECISLCIGTGNINMFGADDLRLDYSRLKSMRKIEEKAWSNRAIADENTDAVKRVRSMKEKYMVSVLGDIVAGKLRICKIVR